MAKLGGCIPNLPVRDCVASIRWYVEELGFTVDWDDAALGFDHTMYVSLSHDDFQLCLDEHDRGRQPHGIWCYVDDVHGLHAELESKDVEIAHPPREEPWGEICMEVLDPDGHRIGFTQRAEGADAPEGGSGEGDG